MKKIFAVLHSAAPALSLSACGENRGLGGVSIINYTGDSPNVRIPDTIKGDKVVKVDLSKCKKELQQLVVPDTALSFSASNDMKRSLQYIGLLGDTERNFQVNENLRACLVYKGKIYDYEHIGDLCKAINGK